MIQPELTPAQQRSRERVLAQLKETQARLDAEGPHPADMVRSPNGDRHAPWEDPVPLGRDLALPAFPLHALPPWLATYVGGVAHATQTPPEMAGTLCLTVLAAAAGGRAVVEVRDGWREPLNLFTAVAMVPGTRKTPVYQRVTEPLTRAERAQFDLMKPEILDAQVRKQSARELADKAAVEIARAPEPAREEAINYAKAQREMAEAIDVPPMPRMLVDDATPEALASLMAEQRGRIAMFSDEGEVFGMMAGRYSGGANLGVYLKGHAGSPLRVDRKGRPPEYIPAPALTMGLTIQPGVLASLQNIDGGRDRGLLARFLWVIPPSTVGGREVAPDPVPLADAKMYEQLVGQLVDDLAGWTDPAVLVFQPRADLALQAFESALEPRLHPDWGDLAMIADWASKLAGHTARLAGLLHLAERAEGRTWQHPVEPETVERAREIGEFFLAHAIVAFDVMGANPVVADARALLPRLKDVEVASEREIHRTNRYRFLHTDDLRPVLELLVGHGYIRRVPQKPTSGRGRPPSPRFEVHPLVTEGRID